MSAVAKKKDQLPTTGLNDALAQSGFSGFEEATSSSYAIPFLKLLQSGSPQCKRSNGEYIEGAAEGMVLHTISGQLFKAYEEPLHVIPCSFRECVNEWVPRAKGGGIVESHSVSSNVKRNARAVEDPENGKMKLVLPNGNELVDTANHYVLVWVGNEWEPALLSCVSSNLTFSRKWMSHMRNLKMDTSKGRISRPMFGSIYGLKTISRTKGEDSWYVFDFERIDDVGEPELIEKATDYISAINSGLAKEDVTNYDAETGEVVDS